MTAFLWCWVCTQYRVAGHPCKATSPFDLPEASSPGDVPPFPWTGPEAAELPE